MVGRLSSCLSSVPNTRGDWDLNGISVGFPTPGEKGSRGSVTVLVPVTPASSPWVAGELHGDLLLAILMSQEVEDSRTWLSVLGRKK